MGTFSFLFKLWDFFPLRIENYEQYYLKEDGKLGMILSGRCCRFLEVGLIYKVVLVLAAQQSDSIIHISIFSCSFPL